MAAFLFIQAGTMKLLAFPVGMPPDVLRFEHIHPNAMQTAGCLTLLQPAAPHQLGF